jgi:hypothetical protein
LFSDIPRFLTPWVCCHSRWRGPKFAHVVRDEATAVAKLEVPDTNKLRYVFDAVTSIRHSPVVNSR